MTRRLLALLPLGLIAGAALAACEPAARDEADAAVESTAPAEAPPPEPARDSVLEAAFRDIARELDGAVGIAAMHLEENVRAGHDAERRFPLASVYKLPIAYAAVQRDGAGPADTVRILPSDHAPGESPFTEPGGMAVPFSRLVERSIAHSDNTASDVLLRVAGGPEEVMRRVRALGVRDVRVDRTLRQIFAEWRGILDLEGHEDWSLRQFEARSAEVPARVREEAQSAFVEDVRDTGTAQGMVDLLAALHRGQGLTAEGRALLLEALHGSVTGPARIRAGVPSGTEVGHKTGTLGPLSHDVGIVTLPEGRGHAVLAVLMNAPDASVERRERAIAAASRAVWERWGVPVAGAGNGAADGEAGP